MNLYWRLLLTIIAAWRAGKVVADITAPQRLRLRVYPNDLDFNGHMNNGRYLTLMDLGRLHLVMRTGLMRMVITQKLAPTLAAVQMRYRMQMLPFQPFDLESRVLCWDDKWIYMEQRFLYVKGPKAGAVAAIGLVKGAFYDRRIKTTLPTKDLLAQLGWTAASPAMPAYVADWARAEESLRAVTA
ncbi:MAG: thioesterase family protein [Alphaproteobacteria bacterium]|nr:thioesterase family protein [Alphaproteobacteria bacterium]